MNTIMEKLMEKLDIDMNGKVSTEALNMSRHMFSIAANKTLTYRAAEVEAYRFRRCAPSRSICMGVATNPPFLRQSREGRTD